MLCKHEMEETLCGLCHESPRCRWCNRELTDPISIAFGTGPVCFESDKRAQAGLLQDARQNPGQWYKWGPMLASSAMQWREAIAHLGMTVHIRTMEDGTHIYFTMESD